jgi:hypothetical protein
VGWLFVVAVLIAGIIAVRLPWLENVVDRRSLATSNVINSIIGEPRQ